MIKSIDLGDFYKIPADNRNLNYDHYIEKGDQKISLMESYHSHNTKQLDVDEMKKLLLKLDLFN